MFLEKRRLRGLPCRKQESDGSEVQRRDGKGAATGQNSREGAFDAGDRERLIRSGLDDVGRVLRRDRQEGLPTILAEAPLDGAGNEVRAGMLERDQAEWLPASH